MSLAPSGLQEVDDSTIYFEILVLIDILLGDVLRNDVVSHVAGTAGRGSAFEPLHQAAARSADAHDPSRPCPFMIDTSCCPQMSRIRSRTRVAISPVSAGRRAPRRYSIPEVYPARTR